MSREITDYLVAKGKEHIFTYSVYQDLKKLGITDAAIRAHFNISSYHFTFFINNHKAILGEVEKCHRWMRINVS